MTRPAPSPRTGIYFGPARRWPTEATWIIGAVVVAVVVMTAAWLLVLHPTQPAAGFWP